MQYATAARAQSAQSIGESVIFVAHMAVLSGDHARNSRGAIAECLDASVARIEIDIHSLDGGDYVVYHDRRLDTQTTGTGSIGHATPDDIRAVRFREREDRPPLLSEVVEMALECESEIQLDLKDWRPMPDDRLRVLAEVVAPIAERVIVSTGQDWNLRRLHRVAPHIAHGFDPGHYIDHATEGQSVFLPRTMSAYGYRDDHPISFGKTETPADYLRERMEALGLQAPAAREYFLSYRLVLQMLDDGFNPAEFLHHRGIDANVWTFDHHGPDSVRTLGRLADAGIDRVTTNTLAAWQA